MKSDERIQKPKVCSYEFELLVASSCVYSRKNLCKLSIRLSYLMPLKGGGGGHYIALYFSCYTATSQSSSLPNYNESSIRRVMCVGEIRRSKIYNITRNTTEARIASLESKREMIQP